MIGKLIEDTVGGLTDLYLKLKEGELNMKDINGNMVMIVFILSLMLVSVLGILAYLIVTLDPGVILTIMAMILLGYLSNLVLRD